MIQLLYFTSPTCGPCRAISPAVDAFHRGNPRGIPVMTVNTSDPRGLQFAQQYGVQVTPTLILVSHGHEVARLNLNSGVALNNPSAIQAWTDQF